ncbi:hypothetical protein B0H10DRAFT_2230970 [Mycena sp. CBHHK59/15]|nr:hypothetical protein B0H10DRAFT_2230970 [Mycena sp. CBHHK59/15]
MFPDPLDWPDPICSYVYGTVHDGAFDQGPTINTIHTTICCRNHWLIPQHCEWCLFLQSLLKKTMVSAPPAAIHAVIAEPTPIPSPIAFPLEPPPPTTCTVEPAATPLPHMDLL